MGRPIAAGVIVKTLLDEGRPAVDRILAAKMAGDLVVTSDDMAESLLTIVRNTSGLEDLRAQAAISFGAGLEQADEAISMTRMEVEDDEEDEDEDEDL